MGLSHVVQNSDPERCAASRNRRFSRSKSYIILILFKLSIVTFFVPMHRAIAQSSQCLTVDPSWKLDEPTVLMGICAGEYSYPGSALTDHSNPKRRVSANFVAGLITDASFEAVTLKHGLRLSNLIIEGRLDLASAHIDRSITIIGSELKDEADFSSAEIVGELNFIGTRFDKRLTLEGAYINGSIELGEKSKGDPDPTKPRGGLLISNIKGNGARVEGEMMIEGTDIPGGVDLESAHVSGTFSITRSRLPYINLTSSIFDNQLIIVDDEVERARSSQNGLDFYSGPSWDANATESIDMFLVRCKQSVFLDRSVFDRPIIISGAVIDFRFRVGGHSFVFIDWPRGAYWRWSLNGVQ